MISITSRSAVNGVLIALTLFSLWLVWHFIVNSGLEAPANPHTPDAFINNLEVITTDINGKWAYHFSSPQLFHYTQDDRVTFISPLLHIREEGAPPWDIQAKSGESLHGGESVQLEKSVILHQAKGSNNSDTRIQTEYLMIYPKKRQAETPQAISAFQPEAQINSTGMKLDVTKKIIYLLSQVNGLYRQVNKPPIYITADQAFFDKSKGITVFEGKVKLTQGQQSLDTSKLTLYTDRENHLTQAVAEGQGTHYQSVSTAEPEKPPFIATAETMKYFPLQNEIHLIGQAKATQGADSYAAPEIHYHIDSQQVVSHQGQTTIVIQPQTLTFSHSKGNP